MTPARGIGSCERGREPGEHVDQRRCDARGCEHGGEPDQRGHDEADERAERRLGIAVGTAARGHAAARLREAQRDGAHGDGAGDVGQRRGGPDLRCDRSGKNENARADDDIDDIRRQPERAYDLHQPAIAMLS